ncbi:MAG: site-specific integrase [Rikenellaceae bacterium]
MRSTFKLLFYINKQKIKVDGTTTIMGRITVDGKVAQYSTGITILPNDWNAAKGRAKSDKSINRSLDELEANAKMTYKRCVDRDGFVSAEIIKNAVTGRVQVKDTLLTLFDEHIEEYAKRVGVDRVRKSYTRRLTVRKHLCNFMAYKYDIKDIPLRALTMQFIDDFKFYLSVILQIKTISYNDYLLILRMVLRIAISKKIIKRDPFAGHRLESVAVKHRHLSREQIMHLMSLELPTYRLCHTRDLFIFSVFTGLGRAEVAELSEHHLERKADGSTWIHIKRAKTKVDCAIKLLDIPLKIIEKYRGEGKDGKLFFVPLTASICKTMRIIEEQYNLDYRLTYYMARHSFAVNCLNNGVPIETISKMMGHSSIRTTQIYAEITNQKIGQDMGLLAENTQGQYALPKDNMPLRVYQCGRYSGWKDEVVNE